MELLKHDGHWCEAHCLRPDLGNDEVDDHGGCLEQFGKNGVAVVEDGSA